MPSSFDRKYPRIQDIEISKLRLWEVMAMTIFEVMAMTVLHVPKYTFKKISANQRIFQKPWNETGI